MKSDKDKAHLPGQTSRPAPLANSSVMVSKSQCDPACSIQAHGERDRMADACCVLSLHSACCQAYV